MVESKVPHYRHDLGDGLYLDAFSLNPEMDEAELREFVSSRDGQGGIDLRKIQYMRCTNKVDSFIDLGITVSADRYEIPEQLKAYREALETKLDSEVREDGSHKYHNGPVAIIDRPFQVPLRFRPGGYYDFLATKIGEIPAELLPGKYPEGKTIAELMIDWDLGIKKMARFFGFGYLMQTNNGERISLVQRAKGVGIADDRISNAGSTPRYKEEFLNPKFDFETYYREHIAQEMNEEYDLKKDEFSISGIDLIDDISAEDVPHLNIRILTPCTTEELASRIHGKEDAIKEHPVLYEIRPDAISTVLQRFHVWHSIAHLLNMVYLE